MNNDSTRKRRVQKTLGLHYSRFYLIARCTDSLFRRKILENRSSAAPVEKVGLILDGAGWHSSPQLILPKNIVLMPLPSYAPELNSVENLWDYLRSNFLSHCVWDTYEAILDACCDAWNALMAKSEVIVSIGTREWAQVKT